MSGILARVMIRHEQGATISHFCEKGLLDQIGLVPTKFDPNETFFNVNDVITIDGRELKIIRINTKFYNKTHEPHNYGINMYGVGEELPYNFEITYVVNDVQ